MPEFTVTLTAPAHIRATTTVEASSRAAAVARAVGCCPDANWPIDEYGNALIPDAGRAWASEVDDENLTGPHPLPDGTGLSPKAAAELALGHLKCARDLLKVAGAERTLYRVRLAITSADGAVRHAKGVESRREIEGGV